MTHPSQPRDTAWQDARNELLCARCSMQRAMEAGDPDAYISASWEADAAREQLQALEATGRAPSLTS